MSSKRHLRRTKCERKLRFRSRDLARLAAKDVLRNKGELLDVFKCGFCGQWHMGHRPARVEREAAQGIAAFKARQKIAKAKLRAA